MCYTSLSEEQFHLQTAIQENQLRAPRWRACGESMAGEELEQGAGAPPRSTPAWHCSVEPDSAAAMLLQEKTCSHPLHIEGRTRTFPK